MSCFPVDLQDHFEIGISIDCDSQLLTSTLPKRTELRGNITDAKTDA